MIASRGTGLKCCDYVKTLQPALRVRDCEDPVKAGVVFDKRVTTLTGSDKLYAVSLAHKNLPIIPCSEYSVF